MDWLGDFLAFCFHSGLGGLALLALAGLTALIVVVGVLYAFARVLHGGRLLGHAFADGWRGASKD